MYRTTRQNREVHNYSWRLQQSTEEPDSSVRILRTNIITHQQNPSHFPNNSTIHTLSSAYGKYTTRDYITFARSFCSYVTSHFRGCRQVCVKLVREKGTGPILMLEPSLQMDMLFLRGRTRFLLTDQCMMGLEPKWACFPNCSTGLSR